MSAFSPKDLQVSCSLELSFKVTVWDLQPFEGSQDMAEKMKMRSILSDACLNVPHHAKVDVCQPVVGQPQQVAGVRVSVMKPPLQDLRNTEDDIQPPCSCEALPEHDVKEAALLPQERKTTLGTQ